MMDVNRYDEQNACPQNAVSWVEVSGGADCNDGTPPKPLCTSDCSDPADCTATVTEAPVVTEAPGALQIKLKTIFPAIL